MTETTLIPGTATEWEEFKNEDYDPKAEPGSDEDMLGEFLKERTEENMFGVVIVANLTEDISDGLVKRLAAQRVPTKVRRSSESESKLKDKKHK